jgi:uncharacterized membrane protein YqjE
VFGNLHLLTGLGVLVVVVALVALDIYALVEVWRDARRSLFVKIIWTAVILVLPAIGGIGWLVNWSLGKRTDSLNRRATT